MIGTIIIAEGRKGHKRKGLMLFTGNIFSGIFGIINAKLEAKMEIRVRFFRHPEGSFFLFGPRGTGKSTWLKMQFDHPLYVDLLSPDLFRLYSSRPERLKELAEGNRDMSPIILDEIQRVPALLYVVHQLLEEKRGYRFILTGSSARKLKRGGVDLLSGRAVIKTLHPFMASELEDFFNLESSLNIGLLPLVLNSVNPEEVLDSYCSLYLREEVQFEGLVRDIGHFARFLESISFSHASVLNISEVARECQVGRKTVEGYLSVLEDLLLSFTIPVFAKRAKRRLISHSKLFLFDTGVFRSLRQTGPLDRTEEIHGQALEGLVAQHLRAWISYRNRKNSLYFWRTKAGNEVDFIIYGEDGLCAIEVKTSRNIR